MASLHKISNSVHKTSAASTQHGKLVKQSQRLVSQTFFGTMLKQMHESPFKSKLFDGGAGGQAFSTMLDQHLADHMSRGSSQKLVKAIVRHIEKNTGAKKQTDSAKKSQLQSRFKQSSYRKTTAGDRRSNVAADFRA